MVDGRLVPTPTTGLVGFECTSAFMGIKGDESVPLDAVELLLFEEFALAGLRYCARVSETIPTRRCYSRFRSRACRATDRRFRRSERLHAERHFSIREGLY